MMASIRRQEIDIDYSLSATKSLVLSYVYLAFSDCNCALFSIRAFTVSNPNESPSSMTFSTVPPPINK